MGLLLAIKRLSPKQRWKPGPQNKPGQGKKGAEATRGFNPGLEVKGNGRQKPPSFHDEGQNRGEREH